MKRNLTIEKYIILFLVGGLSYYNIELLYRGNSHISMLICGGLSMILIGGIDQFSHKPISIWKQMIVGSIIITTLEFITGVIVNLWLKLNIWDYSSAPFNLLGQICLHFSIYWFFLSYLCIIVDNWIREKVFGEPKPGGSQNGNKLV